MFLLFPQVAEICWVEMTVECIPVSLVFIYLNIIILLKMGKLFTVFYTSTSIGFCKTRINQLACEESMEKLEIIFTFSFIVLYYTAGFQSVVQVPVESLKVLHGVHRVLPFSVTYLCKGIFSLYALYKYLETD